MVVLPMGNGTGGNSEPINITTGAGGSNFQLTIVVI